jgi:NAD-dependent oxidoreductase involved in siderophore biosynthesis
MKFKKAVVNKYYVNCPVHGSFVTYDRQLAMSHRARFVATVRSVNVAISNE